MLNMIVGAGIMLIGVIFGHVITKREDPKSEASKDASTETIRP